MNGWEWLGLFFLSFVITIEIVSAPIEWFWPYSWGGRTIWRGKRTAKVVSLTFDDGPSQYTSKVLDILDEHEIPATFFVIGSQVEKFPDVVRRIIATGHAIGNHLFSFEAQRGLYKFFFPVNENEITKTQGIVESLTGRLPQYFRSPGAQMGRNFWYSVRKHNLIVVNGSIPFPNPESDALSQLITIKTTLKPGAIIILHDGNDHDHESDRPRIMLELLPMLINLLEKRGYKIVTLEENVEVRF